LKKSSTHLGGSVGERRRERHCTGAASDTEAGATPLLNLEARHWHELTVGSAIAPDIAALNWESVGGQGAWSRILQSLPHSERRNDGRVRDWILKKYSHLDDGGLWASGLDPCNGWQPMEWGQLKPNLPRRSNDGKPIKYEAPLKTETRAFFPRVTWEIGQIIAQRSGLTREYQKRIQQAEQQSSAKTPTQAKTESREAARPTAKHGHRNPTHLHRGTGGMASSDLRPGNSPVTRDVSPTEFLKTEDREFWPWVQSRSQIPIACTEGAKKAGAILSAGYATVALPGVWNGQIKLDEWGRRRQLKPELEAIAQPGREIIFAFDRDRKLSTCQAVAKAIKVTGRLFEAKGCTVSIAEWDDRYKGADDFIATGGDFHAAIANRIPLEAWKTRYLYQLTYPADIEIPPTQRYMGPLDIPADAKFVAMRGLKGVGKTESLADIIAAAQSEGVPCLILSHRRQLARALGMRFGVPYVEELKTSDQGKTLGYALCFDSLHAQSAARFSPAGWGECYVVLDECEQSIWHLLEADTDIAEHRVEVLGNTRELVVNVLTSQKGKLFLSDADLSDVSIDYIRDLSGVRAKPFVVRHDRAPRVSLLSVELLSHYQHQFDAMALYFLSLGLRQAAPYFFFSEGDAKVWAYQLFSAIASGQKVLVQVTGQKPKSRWGSRNLERLCQQMFPDKRVLRIDSTTVANPEHPASGCLSKLNFLLGQYDIVIASPVIETGVSIDLKGHFDSVWVCAQGLSTADTVRQVAARCRDIIPRFVWCPEQSVIGLIGNGSVSPFALLRSEDKRLGLTLKQLRESDLETAELEADLDTDFQRNSSQKCWAKMAARINLSCWHYRETIVSGILGEGHDALAWLSDRDLKKNAAQFDKTVKKSAQEGEREYCQQVHEATPPDSATEYRELKDKRDKNEAQMQQVERYELEMKYGKEYLNEETIAADRAGIYPRLRLHYYLTIGKAFLEAKDFSKLQQLKASGQGKLMPRDANKKSWLWKILPFVLLGVPELLEFAFSNPDYVWKNDDPMLAELVEKIRYYRDLDDFLKLPNPDGEKMTPIKLFKLLLDRLGLKLEAIRDDRGNKRREGGGSRCWLYRFVPPVDGREALFAAWQERDRSFAEEAKAAASTEGEPSTDGNNKKKENSQETEWVACRGRYETGWHFVWWHVPTSQWTDENGVVVAPPFQWTYWGENSCNTLPQGDTARE